MTMNRIEAYRVLRLKGTEDALAIKRQYRRLMGRFHPDTAGNDSQEHLKRAQRINEAYDFLKNYHGDFVQGSSNGEAKPGQHRRSEYQRADNRKPPWQGECNEAAFCERPVYQYYHLDDEDVEKMYYQAAFGKYIWHPGDEEFALFIMSIHHAVKKLTEDAENHVDHLRMDRPDVQNKRFEIQAQLFHMLAQQFVQPIQVMKQFMQPVKYDEEGRAVWHFRAWIGTKSKERAFQRIASLHPGEPLYPKSFSGSKILVRNKEGQTLGHLSFEEDWIYLCVIPLLKQKLAQVRLTAAGAEIRKGCRPYAARADVDFYLRVEKNAEVYRSSADLNLKIADLLLKYELYLK